MGETAQEARSTNTLSANALSDNALGQNALGQNALGQNALGQNALGQNALGQNALAMSALNDPTPSGDPTFPTKGLLAEELLRYMYKCALPSGSTMTLSLDRGQVQLKGELGLAPQWETGSCDSSCEHWVSACVLARLNGYGVPIDISMRGNHPALATTAGEEGEFALFEARFWGNIFRDEFQNNHMACRGDGATMGHLTSRVCASTGGNCSLTILGSCSASCDVLGNCPATTAAGGAVSVPSIGVWLRPPTPAMCGDGTCQAGETSAACAFDCPSNAAVVDHETPGKYAKTSAAAPLNANVVVYAGITDSPTLAGLGAQNPPQLSGRDIFVVQANADGTFAAATRFAAGAEEIVGIDADDASGRVVLATTTQLRVLSAGTLATALSWSTGSASTRFRLESVRLGAAGIHTTGVSETASGGAWVADSRQYRRYDPATGRETNSARVAWTTVNAPWVQWAGDECTGAAARGLSSTQLEVRGIQLKTGKTCDATNWTQPLTVPGVNSPTPVAIREGGIVAGTNGAKTTSFVGRVQPGTGAWAWLNRLDPPDPSRSVTITSMALKGHNVIVAGKFKGPIDFRGSITSFSPGKRPGVNANEDGFIAAYEQASGRLRWVRSYGGPGSDAMDAFAFDGQSRLWGFGTFVGRPLLDGQFVTSVDGDLGVDSMRVIVGPVPLGDYQPVFSGASASHLMAMRADGTLWAWGNNADGQLGDSSTVTRTLPVQIPAVLGAVSGAMGDRHSLALKGDGTVWAWGANDRGQLGDGTTTPRATPVRVSNLSGVVDLGSGRAHGLALKADGTVWAWGANDRGQLGDGTTTDRPSAVQIAGFSGVVELAGGDDYSVALKGDGTVWSWGSNVWGRLGSGTASDRLTPGPVVELKGVVDIKVGTNFALALKGDGTVWAWGADGGGQCGQASGGFFNTPVQVPSLTGITAITAGAEHAVALRADGTVWAWGQYSAGYLNYPFEPLWMPIQVPGISGATAVNAVSTTTAVRLQTGELRTWGYGPLGDGSTGLRLINGRVRGVFEATYVSAWDHGVALSRDGSVWTWGNGAFGALGDGRTETRIYAAKVPGIGGVDRVIAGESFTVARKDDGTVWAWGKNASGQLGDGSTIDRPTPVQVAGLSNVSAVAVGKAHAYGLKADGTVWAWGDNASGQLGDGTTTPRATPVQVSGLTNVVAVDAGWSFGLARRSDGTLWAWGHNGGGQLGDGTTVNRLVPVQVSGLNGVVGFAGGSLHAIAVTSSGAVWTWGANASGQLGDGTTAPRLTPAEVPGLAGMVDVGAGDQYSTAIRSDGTVWSWGANSAGQLGDGTTATRLSPVRVPNLTSVSKVVARKQSTLVVRSDGTVWSWGANAFGQLGDRSITSQLRPVQALDL